MAYQVLLSELELKDSKAEALSVEVLNFPEATLN